MADKHTLWHTRRNDHEAPDDMIVMDEDGASICDCAPGNPDMTLEEACANAALIVRAVNHHEELVAFLKPLAGRADYLEQHFELAEHPGAVDPETHLVMPGLSLADCQRIRAVLKKMKDEGHA